MFHQAQFCFYIFSFLFYSPSLSHYGTHWASFFCHIFSNNGKILETLSLKAKTDHMYSRNTKFLKWAFKLCYYTCWALFFQLGFNILDLIGVGREEMFFSKYKGHVPDIISKKYLAHFYKQCGWSSSVTPSEPERHA